MEPCQRSSSTCSFRSSGSCGRRPASRGDPRAVGKAPAKANLGAWKSRVGVWHRPVKAPRGKLPTYLPDDYLHFLRRYGSLTWLAPPRARISMGGCISARPATRRCSIFAHITPGMTSRRGSASVIGGGVRHFARTRDPRVRELSPNVIVPEADLAVHAIDAALQREVPEACDRLGMAVRFRAADRPPTDPERLVVLDRFCCLAATTASGTSAWSPLERVARRSR